MQKPFVAMSVAQDVSQTFSETLQRSGVEVTSVELLDVPHVYTTVQVPAAEQPNDSRHHEMMLWFFLGVGSSLFAGVAACSSLSTRGR